MNIFGFNISKREAIPTPAFANNSEPEEVQEEAVGQPQNAGADFGSNKIFVTQADAALKIAAWYRGVELRANTMSQLCMQYQKFDNNGKNYVQATRGAVAQRMNYLLQVQPNPTMTWAVMMRQSEINLLHEGNAVWYIDRDEGGEVRAFWLCSDATLNISAMTYTITYNGLGGAMTLTNVKSADVIHIRNTFTQYNGLVGVSTLQYAGNVLSLSATNEKQAFDNAGKGGKLKLLIQEEKQASFGIGGRASKKELQKVTDQLNEELYTKDVVLLNNVCGVHPISMTLQQQELDAMRRLSVSDVGRLLGCPLSLLMDYSNSSYKTPEAASQELLTRTIAPRIREWEDEFNTKLVGMEGYGKMRFHLCELPLLRMDLMQQANIDKLHLETGVMSVNELRARYDLPAVDEGDRHYISTNLAEVGSAKLNGESTIPANDDNNNEEEGGN